MSTPELDRLYDEIRASTPKDIPTGTPVDLIAGGRTFKITEMFATPVGDTLNLVVKHQTPDISDSTRTYQDNLAVIKALVAKYPEIREAFGGIVARAVAPNGQDFGTLLAMKDVK
jgi:dihydrofolate reductase